MTEHPVAVLPFPVGAVLRCTRWTEWGTETVYGTVKEWHNEQGWVVLSPHGGIAASPGPSAFIDFRESAGMRVESEEWRFEPVEAQVHEPVMFRNGGPSCPADDS